MRTRPQSFIGTCIELVLAIIVYLDNSCEVSGGKLNSRALKVFAKPTERTTVSFDDILANDTFKFDINGRDVIVFLHIQKAGGTKFGKHLVRDLALQRSCSCKRKNKRCVCYRPNRDENWLFSRYAPGWNCQVHADWTELAGCVDSALNKLEVASPRRRYFYITMMRDPVARYLSEFLHVQRGARWLRRHGHWCGDTWTKIPKCYSGTNWTGVTLDEFMDCPHNLANNRQTRMIADLSVVGCYNSSLTSEVRDYLLMASAKKNLQDTAFLMLTDYQKVGQYSFEETFGMKFTTRFEHINRTLAFNLIPTLTREQLERVRSLNKLDLELYDFAKNLALVRFEKLRARDSNFVLRYQQIDKLPVQLSARLG